MKECVILLSLFTLLSPALSEMPQIEISSEKKHLSLISHIYTYNDESGKLTINEVKELKDKFIRNKAKSLNFGYSSSSHWLYFSIRNISPSTLNYIISIANPDLNIIEFYEFTDKTSRKILTGETADFRSRDVVHNHFLFNISLEPDKVYDYYFKINSEGEANYVPIHLQEERFFRMEDEKEKIIKWSIYGLLIFVVIFNFYLYKSTRDIINFHYAFYILFGALFLIISDGYHSYLNIPWLTNRSKTIIPAITAIFLLNFSQIFLETKKKWPLINNVFNFLKICAALLAIFYFFKFPLFVVSLIGIPITVMVTFSVILIGSVFSFNKNYLPSIFFLSAFFFMLFGVFIFQLKEFGILPSSTLFENSIRIGMTIEAILLTIAVLERFRIQQENSKKTIQESYEKIQDQKNELVKVNTELEKLSLVASETENSVAIYDINGNIEWCNAGFERLYDTTFDELLKNGSFNIRNIINHDNIEQLLDFSIENTQAVFFENMIKTKKKKQVWLQTTITPYFSRETNLTKLIAIDSDISELKLYERNLTTAKEKAEESDRLKTSFLANMSHEIRTPLNGIIGFSDLLKRDDLTQEKRIRYFNIIDANGQQLLNLIDDILDISLIESNQLKISITEFDINAVMDEIFEYYNLYKETTGKANIEFSLYKGYKEGGYLLKSDPDRLRQVLSNLINNAFKITEKGKISFGYAPDNSCLKFFVEDSGPGISNTQKDTLFKRFRQGEETLKRKHGGAGLGLSISKGIIDLLGGNIWHDESYKEGARFYFTLPVI